MWEEHLSGTYLEALLASLAINYSMQKQQQLRMDRAQFGLIKPARNNNHESARTNFSRSNVQQNVPRK